MKFFFDNCISCNLVLALRAVCGQRHAITHLTDRFKPNVKDPEWLSALGKEPDWFVISGDPRITRGKAERAAWKESELTVFFFGDGFTCLGVYEKAAFLFRRWPDIVIAARNSQNGTGYLLHIKGKEIDQVYA